VAGRPGQGLGQYGCRAHGDAAEQLGPGRRGRDQVVAAVKGRAEDDVGLVQQGERPPVAGGRDMGGVGPDDRHPLGARRQQAGQAAGQAVAQVAMALGQQPEPGGEPGQPLPGPGGGEAQPGVGTGRGHRRQRVGQHGRRRPGRPRLAQGRRQAGLGQPGHRLLGDHAQGVGPGRPAHRPARRGRAAPGRAPSPDRPGGRSARSRKVTAAMAAAARTLPRSDPETLLAPPARGR
jgi:hypothetical protein